MKKFPAFGVRLMISLTVIMLTSSYAHKKILLKDAPSAVQLSISANFLNLPHDDNSAGTFTASGFLNTSGTTHETVRIASNTFHAQTVFTTSNGTFTAKLNGQYIFTGENTVEGSGTWVIIKGTGVFHKLHGQGNMTFQADFAAGTITDQWTGHMH